MVSPSVTYRCFTSCPRSQTPDSKKEEFRRYLEKSGAIESLTSVLVGLYEESDRPLESTEYIKKYLGAAVAASSSRGGAASSAAAIAQQMQQQQETEKLRKDNGELKTQVKELNKTIETLRANLKHARAEAKKANAAAAAATAASEAACVGPSS